jgi:hypothetical protein
MGCGTSKAPPPTAPKKILVTTSAKRAPSSGAGAENIDEADPLPLSPHHQLNPAHYHDNSTVEEILSDIAKKLKLPNQLISKCIDTLHENGVFILEPLKRASEMEWMKLNLPIAVSRELKDIVNYKPTNQVRRGNNQKANGESTRTLEVITTKSNGSSPSQRFALFFLNTN